MDHSAREHLVTTPAAAHDTDDRRTEATMPHSFWSVARRVSGRRVFTLLTAGLFLGTLATPAFAQDVCFDRADHDGDGMGSYAECNFGTNPLDPDSDHDGLNDPAEVYTHGTNPNNPETDGDGLSDTYELGVSDPLVNNNEVAPAPAPVEEAPAAERPDRDGDQLYDDDETGVYGTNPDVFDTDGDGSSDGYEVWLGTSPLDPAVG